MNQESFRLLVQTPHFGSSTGKAISRGSLLAAGSKPKTVDASQPAFKPRKVKKSQDLKYRDRAAERRVGEGNDYAQVEAVLEDFEKRTAENGDKSAVDEQRQYLGGDGDHSILVRGLDISLLEQNKAKANLSTEDDDSLEQAFQEATVPRKRTREDLIKELKEKRGQSTAASVTKVSPTVAEEAQLLEEAKKKGKFKPIGFKPIVKPDEDGGKKKKVKVDGERKKKKRKVQADGAEEMTPRKDVEITPPLPKPSVPTSSQISPLAELEPEIEDSFDIFVGAGEYEGIDVEDDDDDDDDDDQPSRPNKDSLKIVEESNILRRWVPTEENQQPSKPTGAIDLSSGSLSRAPLPQEIEEGEAEEEEMRLVPLASSALPSIKEYLAMEKAANSYGGKKKRKEKKKGGDEAGVGDDEDKKKRTAEAKVERDYKRLKSYTDKKAGQSKS